MRCFKYVVAIVGGLFLVNSVLLAQQSSREDFEKFCDAVDGRWVGEVTWITDWPGFGSKGDKVTGYVEAERSLDGNALVGAFYGGAGTSRLTIVYDAGARQIRELNVSNSGIVREVVHHLVGNTWTRKITGSNPDGAKVEGLTTIKISDDGNTHHWSGQLTVGGKKTDEVKDVWRRISKGDRPDEGIASATSKDFEEYCRTFQGRWIGDVTWIADWPGFGKKGDKVTAYTDWKLSADGKVLHSKYFGGGGTGFGITFFDPGDKTIREVSISSGGTVWHGTVAKKDGNWTGIFTGSNPDGGQIKGSYVTHMADDGNSFQNSGSTTIAGKPVDELQDKWRRVSK